MVKYKYKLEGLLKLRKFKESHLKVELGTINQSMTEVKNQLSKLRDNIKSTYHDQEKVLSSAASGQMAQFYPYYIQGQREDIKNKESLLYSLEKKYEKKLEELSTAMAESKLINNMKEKDFNDYKKKLEKKQEGMREDLNQITRLFKEQQ